MFDQLRGNSEIMRARCAEKGLEHFKRLGNSNDPAAPYFAAALEVLRCKKFFRGGREFCLIGTPTAYSAAVAEIVTDAKINQSTPLLVVAIDPLGEVWPGDD